MPNLPAPHANLVVRYGSFELLFITSEGAGEAISWEFVRDWAALMHRVTEQGYTGIYDQGWWDVAGRLGIYVGLRVADLGARGQEVVGSSS